MPGPIPAVPKEGGVAGFGVVEAFENFSRGQEGECPAFRLRTVTAFVPASSRQMMEGEPVPGDVKNPQFGDSQECPREERFVFGMCYHNLDSEVGGLTWLGRHLALDVVRFIGLIGGVSSLERQGPGGRTQCGVLDPEFHAENQNQAVKPMPHRLVRLAW